MIRPAAVTGRNLHGFAIWGEVGAVTRRDSGRVSGGRKVVISSQGDRIVVSDGNAWSRREGWF